MRRPRKHEPPFPFSPLWPRETLEEAVARVAADYARFVQLGAASGDDPRAFAAHHGAAKAALAHLAAIRELAGLEPPESDPAADALRTAREGMAEEG